MRVIEEWAQQMFFLKARYISFQIFRRNYALSYKEIVRHNLSFPIRGKLIRLYPKRAIKEVCMRLEIYGCQGKMKEKKPLYYV